MKIRISHQNGQYDITNHSDLCELFCTPDGETPQYLFENGWLPYSNEEWYQCRSSRVKIKPISARRKFQLAKIRISKSGDYKEIFEKSKYLYDPIIEDFLDTVLSFDHEIYYFNNSVFGVLNWFGDIPYFSLVVGGKLRREGITPMTCYFFINELLGHTYPYLYIGEWYEQFFYKSHYPNFEWWDGQSWNVGNS